MALMQVSLEQGRRVDSLAMNITMLSSLLSQPQAGTAVLSGINVFESCATSIESNCTIQPATMPDARSVPCLTPEVLLNQVNMNDVECMINRIILLSICY